MAHVHKVAQDELARKRPLRSPPYRSDLETLLKDDPERVVVGVRDLIECRERVGGDRPIYKCTLCVCETGY